jgi:carbon storage regulator
LVDDEEREAWMLVITRKEGERIVIGDEIVSTVLESTRGSVRIGVEAPRELSVIRVRELL